ncbi:MAG: hypothetical protein CML98_03460 [Rhodobiaceae bacterium]|nr:hypothetical protein [Rhodobiaceae bacterium]
MHLKNRNKFYFTCSYSVFQMASILFFLFIGFTLFNSSNSLAKTELFPLLKPTHYALTGENLSIPKDKAENLKIMSITKDDYAEFYEIFKNINNNKYTDKEISNLVKKYNYSNVLTHKIISWYLLRSNETMPELSEMHHFLVNNQDWPDTKKIRKKIENYIIMGPIEDEFVVDYFKTFPPLSGDGYLAYSISKFKSQEYKEAKEFYDYAWHMMKITAEAKQSFINYCKICISRDDNIKRFDRMLYLGDLNEIDEVSKFIGTEYESLATIARNLKNKKNVIANDFYKIESYFKNNSSFHYLKINWLNKKNNTKKTYEYFNKYKNTLTIKNPTLWGVQAEILGRSLIKEKKYREAYEVMSLRNTEENQIFSNLEFLKGWISLRIFNDTFRSTSHFKKIYELSPSDDNMSMALYWIAENYSIIGDPDEEIRYLSESAIFSDTFYGLISLDKLNRNNRSLLIIDDHDQPNPQENIDLEKIIAVELLVAIDKKYLAAKFINKVFEDDKNYNYANYLANLANLKHLPQTSIKIAKKTGVDRIKINHLYPVVDFPINGTKEETKYSPKELIYSIIRQESEFSSEAVSYSGAIGMMQIMPDTAKMLSRQEKLKYDLNKVLEDSSYNVQLGSRYIFDLVKEFDGSYIRAISSYNAGPNRIKQWNKNNTTDNVLDWIELIPFKETRYYVKNVLRNVQFYRILLNREDNKFNILDDLERGTASEDS